MSKEVKFSDEYVRGFLNSQSPFFGDIWEQYKQSNPPKEEKIEEVFSKKMVIGFLDTLHNGQSMWRQFLLRNKINEGVKEEVERDYSGVSFSTTTDSGYVIGKHKNGVDYCLNGGNVAYSKSDVDFYFKTGNWIEVKEETPVEQSPLVHSELPKITTEIELLANRISELERKIERNSLDIGHLNRLLGESLMQPTKKNLNVEEPEKREPVLCTEDGVYRYNEDEIFAVTKDGKHLFGGKVFEFYNQDNDYVYYYQKDNAENYQLKNKPCLSYNDVIEISKKQHSFHWGNKDNIAALTELVKSKING